MIRSALSGDVHWQCGKSHPAFNLHTFRPWESCPSGLKFLIFKSGQQAQILPWWYIFSRTAEKMAHGCTQCVIEDRKNLFPRMLTVKNAVPGRNVLFARIFLLHLGIRWFHDVLGIESGAIVKVLGLDDSEWKDVPYYSYDLMHDGNRK